MEYKKPNWTSQHETYMWDENILDEINGRSDITDEKMHVYFYLYLFISSEWSGRKQRRERGSERGWVREVI